MISEKYLPIVTTFVFSLVMSTVMSIAMPFVNTGHVPFPEVLLSIAIALLVSFTAGLILPVGKWGAAIGHQLGLQEKSWPFILVASIPPTVYFTLIMTFVFALQRTGFTSGVWTVFRNDIFIALVIAYVTTVLATPLINAVSFRIASK